MAITNGHFQPALASETKRLRSRPAAGERSESNDSINRRLENRDRVQTEGDRRRVKTCRLSGGGSYGS
uniref:Uncharacterized protein n=1 Tax=Anguilla anguilla TaxID=7936 RepID=A0A0E9RYU6_ANGAN